MRRHVVLRTITTLALAAGTVLSVGAAPPAEAFTPPPEAGDALVANQDSGCHDQEVVVAKPTTGAYGSTLSKPSNILGKLNEAKPFDNNRKVVALWGEEPLIASNRLGGVGIYDLSAPVPSWTTRFPLPSANWTVGTKGDGLAHSVTAIEGVSDDPATPEVEPPDIVVAQTGGIPGYGDWGNVVLFRPTSTTTATMFPPLKLTGVHGVEWDTARNRLFAVGDTYVQSYTYSRTAAQPLTPEHSWRIKLVNGASGGHDIRRRRTGTASTYFVTTNTEVLTFDPSNLDENTAFTVFVKPGTQSTLGGGVKSIDERFDGVVEWAMGDGVFHVSSSPDPKPASGFCMKGYKVRWLYAPGDPVYPNDVPSPPTNPNPSQPSTERFLWEQHWLTGNAPPNDDLAHSREIWVGGGTNNTPTSSAKKVSDAIALGQIPYVKFYQWGDSGNPTMDGVTSMSSTDQRWNSWKDQAVAIANAIGNDREATVVIEPEWDRNAEAPCMARYRTELQNVVNTFHTLAHKAKLVNGVGFWDDGYGKLQDGRSKYHCFQEGTPQLRSLFDGHGFVAHLMSNGNGPDGVACTLRHPNSWAYSHEGPNYKGNEARSKTDSITYMNNMGKRIDKLKSLFDTNRAYITDLFVTRCGWDDQGQADIVGALAAQLQNDTSNLYTTHGLRGVAYRDHGPGDTEAYLGMRNEGMSCYADPCTYKSNVTGATLLSGHNQLMLDQLESGRSGMKAHLASITGPVTDPPDFALTVTNPPSVAPGANLPITLTVSNTGGSYTNAIVDLEIYDPAGVRVPGTGQRFWPGESFANTDSHHYDYDWPAAATPGTYRIKAGVFDSTWHNVKWNDNAGSVVVGTAQPSFTATATATPATLAPDATTSISATVTDNGGALTNGTVRLQVLAPDGTVAADWVSTGQSFTTGQSLPYSGTWTATDTGGTYHVGVVVTSADGATTYYSSHDLATVTVTASKFTSSTAVSRGTVSPGGTSTLTTTVTNTGTAALSNGTVTVDVYDPNGTLATPYSWSGVNLAVGASAQYTATWTAPASPTGVYTVTVGVADSTGTSLHRNDHAAGVRVAAVSFDLSATASEAKVMPGGPTTITVVVTPTGGGVDNAIVDIEVYDAAGVRLADPLGRKFWTGQSLADGVTQTYSWAWTAPATLGTYTVKTGVFPQNWGPVYKWVDHADTIDVANPSHTMTASVSASSVSPGSVVTITARYTNNGGSMTNGIADLEIYDAAGVRVPSTGQKFWTGENIGYGLTSEHTYAWTAPATPGTYTVKLGVFSSDWSKRWGWTDNAVTVSVGSSSFQPSFVIGDGANSWWFEVYTSNDVTSVDVIADGGRVILSLPKKSWGAYAAAPPSEVPAGQSVQIVARRSSDGMSAASTSFGWLTGTPATTPGWAAALAKGANSSTTWVEATAAAAATEVWVKPGTTAWTLLTYSAASGKWGKAMNVATGTKVVFKAKRADGAWGYSTVYTW
jgi:hypothetical protein